MSKRFFYYLLPILLLINSIFSVNQWSSIPLSTTFLEWVINFSIIGICVWYYRKFFHPLNHSDYIIVDIYLLWVLVGVIRGIFVPENYWEWKQLITGTTTLSLPVFVFVFSSPVILKRCLHFWFKYALFAFIGLIWIIPPDIYQFFLGPVLFVSCFLPVIPRKWRLLFIGLLILMLFADFGARSQVIKALMALLMSVAFILAKYLSVRILRILHWFFYALPLVLLVLGISGAFNPLQNLSHNEGKYVEKKIVNGELIEDDLSADTRTFIYAEVIGSALKHHYVLWGRTPARGNDSESFGAYNAENLKTGKYERHSNEVCFPNVFTWLGLIGVILYGLIYLRSSYLAVYKSNNIYMKLLGVFIAFRFTFGWIEDFNRFDIMNISLWMMIAMGFSLKFRMMNDKQFKLWIQLIFYSVKNRECRNKANENTLV